MQASDVTIRPAVKTDMRLVLRHIRKLADYENAPEEVLVTLKDLERDGFGYNPLFHVTVAEYKERIIGIAFYYVGYSTWKGKMLYLDDLYVDEAYRRRGVASMLLKAVFEFAKKIEAKKVRWQVLDWNEPAIEFYKKYPVDMDGEWLNCDVSQKAIETLVK